MQNQINSPATGATNGLRETFKAEIKREIMRVIAKAGSEGTVGMSRDCMWQNIRLNSANGPKGTNAAFVARQIFNEIVSAKPFTKFVYE